MRHSEPLSVASDPRYVFEEEGTSQGLVSRLNISHVMRKDSAIFKCLASNAFGNDIKQLDVRVEEIPEPPLELSVDSKSSRSISVHWRQPYTGNCPLAEYILRVRVEQVNLSDRTIVSVSGSTRDGHEMMSTTTMSSEHNITVNGNATSAVVRSLRPSTHYVLHAFARNRIGLSAASNPLTVITDEEAPGAPPSDVHLMAIDATSIKVDWLPPRVDLANGLVKGYYIGYKMVNSSNHFVYKTVQSHNNADSSTSLVNAKLSRSQAGVGDGGVHSLVLYNLQPYTNYVVILQAFNNVGAGPRSDELIIRTGESAPSFSPDNVRCRALSSQSLKIVWDKLAIERVNGILRGYKVQYRLLSRKDPISDDSSKISEKSEVSRDDTRLILHGLEKFANYSVKVAAFTIVSGVETIGPFSLDVFCKTNEDVPSAPEAIKVGLTSTETAVVSWKEPLTSNGIIRSYTVYKKAPEEQDAVSYTVPHHLRAYMANGLAVGKRYNFWVTATTIGEGIPSPVASLLVTKGNCFA